MEQNESRVYDICLLFPQQFSLMDSELTAMGKDCLPDRPRMFQQNFNIVPFLHDYMTTCKGIAVNSLYSHRHCTYIMKYNPMHNLGW